MTDRRIAKPTSFIRWRGELLRLHPGAEVETMSDERGVVGAAAKLDGKVIASWALVESYAG